MVQKTINYTTIQVLKVISDSSALLNLNLNWMKHLETQDCESLRQTALNIKTFTKLHKDTNNYFQEIIAYCDNFSSKINTDFLSESEESLLLHKQKVLFNQLKE